jgi:hypothetical protein
MERARLGYRVRTYSAARPESEASSESSIPVQGQARARNATIVTVPDCRTVSVHVRRSVTPGVTHSGGCGTG